MCHVYQNSRSMGICFQLWLPNAYTPSILWHLLWEYLLLLQVQKLGNPPVCKIMDYHKEMYKRQEKDKERAKSKVHLFSSRLWSFFKCFCFKSTMRVFPLVISIQHWYLNLDWRTTITTHIFCLLELERIHNIQISILEKLIWK